MDILNWLYIKTADLIRTEANNAKTDLVALGAEVPFTTRGDGYQTYGMTLADAVHAGCTENNTLYTGIYDELPFTIGVPVMLKTCTKVIDTPAFPTFVAVNLQGWKVAGSILLTGQSSDAIYLGTIENGAFFTGYPWKITGTVYTSDGSDTFYSALANGATAYDSDSATFIPIDVMITTQPFPGGLDIFLTYDQNVNPNAEVGAIVSFEFEFLAEENLDITFTYY